MSENPIFDVVDKMYADKEKPSAKPQAKVVAASTGAGVGVAISDILVWVVEASTGIDIPQGVELAFGVVLTAALAFVGGYFKKN